MEIINLFPTTVGVFNLNRDLTIEEKQFISYLPKRPNQLNDASIDTYLLNNNQLHDLKTFFNDCLKQYFDQVYKPSMECSLKITQSWSNYCNDGGGHHSHFHQNSIVSGVFYVQTTDHDKITFHKPREAWSIEPSEFNYYTAKSWWLPAKQYSLVLFPSTLEHSVDKSSRNETRISLSFNTFYSGTIGSISNLTAVVVS